MDNFFDISLDALIIHADKLLRIFFILIATAIILTLTRKILPIIRDHISAQKDNDEDARRIVTLSRVVRYTINVAILVIASLLVLAEFGISVAPILGAAGVAGIAVGFGAQSLVKDYFTGFFMLLENQIRIGDIVEIAGKTGEVEIINLRYVKLRDYMGNVHFIPNSNISIVSNLTRGYSQAIIDVGVAYGENLDHVFAVMNEVAQEMMQAPETASRILGEFEILGVQDWADSAVIIRCRFQVVPKEQWSIRREYLRQLKNRFDEKEIEIPFPHIKLVREQG